MPDLERVVEALLFGATRPLSLKELRQAISSAGKEGELFTNPFSTVKEAEIAAALEKLKEENIAQRRAFQILERSEGWQLGTDPAFSEWIAQLYPAPRAARLSPPALETLAIVAYRQPITRAEMESVRGVAVEAVLQTLLERGLVRIAGRSEVPGRPLLYETTQFFLDHFGLRSLDELPNAEELRQRYAAAAPPPPSPAGDGTSSVTPAEAAPVAD